MRIPWYRIVGPLLDLIGWFAPKKADKWKARNKKSNLFKKGKKT